MTERPATPAPGVDRAAALDADRALPVPDVDLTVGLTDLLYALGASPGTEQSLLYRTLANQPELLRGWLEFAWRLRLACRAPRRLRELMIVRGAQLTHCAYEMHHHRKMALDAGVTQAELDGLSRWRELPSLSEDERAALALMEGTLANEVSDDVLAALVERFPADQRVELILTAGMYSMVPRVIRALRLPEPD
jgi:AhpD family alkylhydroperoxidase